MFSLILLIIFIRFCSTCTRAPCSSNFYVRFVNKVRREGMCLETSGCILGGMCLERVDMCLDKWACVLMASRVS